MADPLSLYSVQYWLERAPQGYLMGTESGHAPLAEEPSALLEDGRLRGHAIRTTGQIVSLQRCALIASAGLIPISPDDESRIFLATQTLDKARHAEIFAHRLTDLGVARKDLEDVIRAHTSSHLDRCRKALLERIDERDFVAGVVGLNVVLAAITFHVLELMQAANESLNPKFAYTLTGAIADERRHLSYGESRTRPLLRERPEEKPRIEELQRGMLESALAVFADAFRGAPRPEEIMALRERITREEGHRPPPPASWHGTPVETLDPTKTQELLADIVCKDLSARFERLGLELRRPEPR